MTDPNTVPSLHLPAFAHRIRTVNGKQQIFDAIRKRWLILKPEEWVRQHMIHYLVDHLGYPSSLISQEAPIAYHRLKKRSDVLVYNQSGKPFLLIECKASHVTINQQVVDQVGIYNNTVNAKLVVVTNGLTSYCWTIDEAGSFVFLEAIPAFNK